MSSYRGMYGRLYWNLYVHVSVLASWLTCTCMAAYMVPYKAHTTACMLAYIGMYGGIYWDLYEYVSIHASWPTCACMAAYMASYYCMYFACIDTYDGIILTVLHLIKLFIIFKLHYLQKLVYKKCLTIVFFELLIKCLIRKLLKCYSKIIILTTYLFMIKQNALRI